MPMNTPFYTSLNRPPFMMRPIYNPYIPPMPVYAQPSAHSYGSAGTIHPLGLLQALVSALFGQGGYPGNSGGGTYPPPSSSSPFGNQNPVQDYLGQFGYDRNIINPLVSYHDAETGVGAGTYSQEKTAYNIYDPTADTNEVYVLSGENSQYMIRNDKGANAFDVRTGHCKEIKLEDLGSDDVIVVSDTDQLTLKQHVKTVYGWEFHVLDEATDSLITIHTRDQDQLNNQTGNWETVSRDWDYVKARLVTELPQEFQ